MAKKNVARKNMADEKPDQAPPAALVLDDTADLQADAANPRSISEEGAAGLRSGRSRWHRRAARSKESLKLPRMPGREKRGGGSHEFAWVPSVTTQQPP